jgi:hypothetical protein
MTEDPDEPAETVADVEGEGGGRIPWVFVSGALLLIAGAVVLFLTRNA